MKTPRCLTSLLVLCTLSLALAANPAAAVEKLSVLLVDGQNNHNWRATTPILKAFLEKSGRFTVNVITTPTARKAPQAEWDKFRPAFADYDVILSNYNGELWPESVQKDLEKYIAGGGGMVVVHAANNAFPQWGEWNKMIGLGWRNNKYGERVTVDDSGNQVRTKKGEGPGADHGPQHDFSIVVRNRKHPVMEGVPAEWLHAKDELYHGQRGPGLNMNILATAYSAKDKRGTEAHEPMVWWIPYGKGRVFTTVMGHAAYSMNCVGFRTIVNRGCEWAATQKVTLPIPENFPKADAVSVVKDAK
jgi:type 1 glutamine amidotransferase